jgi:hypothetical protein
MIKFVIISRRKPGWTRERFFYEWAFIHVALMLQTLPSMQRFRRYVQHFGNIDLPAAHLLLPPPKMRWESFAEHWTETLNTSVPGPEYSEQMQPHSFSDSAMEIAYLQGTCVYQRADFRSGGVKLIHRLAPLPGVGAHELMRRWREEHSPLVIESLKGRGLRKYELDVTCAVDEAEFRGNRKGTLFEAASIEPPLGFEELWFDTLDDALQLGKDAQLRARLEASYGRFVSLESSYSMVVNERVVFDFATPGELTPLPAVLDPASLEAQVFKTGRPYHEPRVA